MTDKFIYPTRAEKRMLRKALLLSSTEAFVRTVLSKDLRQEVNPDVVRAVALKVAKAIPVPKC